MGIIPYESSVDARTGRGSGARLRNSWDASAMGAGDGLVKAGAGLMNAGDELRQERVRKEREETLYGEAMFDPSAAINAVKLDTDADANGYQDAVRLTYQNEVDSYVNSFTDDNVRKSVKERLMARLPSISSQASTYERTQKADVSKERTNAVLNTVRNKVMSDPSSYETAVAMGHEAIDIYGTALPAGAKESMRTQLSYDLAKSKFEGQMNRATTPQALDAVAAELNTPEWQEKLLPRDYEDMNSKIVSGRKAYQTQVSSEAKATLKNLEERSKDPLAMIPQEELVQSQQAVGQSGDINAQQRMARVIRDQGIVRAERKLTPSQLRVRIEQSTVVQDPALPGGLPPQVASVVNETAKNYGVSASYLDATIGREFGGELAKAQPNYAKQNEDGSSATGIMQFTEGTFLKLASDPATATALGVTPDMTKEQILALRGKEGPSIVAGAILAKQNQAYMIANTGRAPSDSELYMAHFLGAPEAVRFLSTMEADREANAVLAFPEAAKSNPNVFKAKDGRELTVGQVYENISRDFAASTTQVVYDDNQVRERMLNSMEKELSGPNALNYAAKVGVVSLTPLDQEGAFAARTKAMETASTYYGRSIQPFTVDEEAYLQKKITDGTVNDTLGVLTSIQEMGPTGAKAAFNQLKVKSPAFAHAGMLALSGDPATAGDVVRGYKRMKENPSILAGLDFKEDKAATDFENQVGGALSRIAPGERQAAQEAATAYLVETKGANGKKYDSESYRQAISKVLGGRVDKLNGEKTYLPEGVPARDMEKVLKLMTLNDYISMSTTGATPMHADGAAIDPRDMEDEVVMRAVGDDTYALADSSGAFIWTGRSTADGYPEKFLIQVKADRVKDILNRQRIQQASK